MGLHQVQAVGLFRKCKPQVKQADPREGSAFVFVRSCGTSALPIVLAHESIEGSAVTLAKM
jgi:hypothetical protein